MIYSLNEIETQCKKAARGAGFEWGHVEETGKAVRWLASNRLPGVELLAAYLNQVSNAATQHIEPLVEEKILFAESNNLFCPLLTGAYLCDHRCIVLQKTIELQQLAYPLLLLPYLARLTLDTEFALSMDWQETKLVCQKGRLQLIDSRQLLTPLAVSVSCQWIQGRTLKCSPRLFCYHVDESAWNTLNQLSCRTYVPATNTSRRGAGPTD